MLRVSYDVLDRLVNLPSKIVDEVKWELDERGLSIRVVDPSHVALGDIFLEKEAFEDYNPVVEEIGINTNRLEQFLNIANKDNLIEIELGDTIELESGNLTQRMPSLDISSMVAPSIPTLDLPSAIKLKGEHLKRGAKATALVSDQMSMKVDNDKFLMAIEEDQDSIEVKLNKDELEEHNCGEIVESIFALDYFSDMVKAISKNEIVELRLGVDYPFKLIFDWADGQGEATYLLAPRIEDA